MTLAACVVACTPGGGGHGSGGGGGNASGGSAGGAGEAGQGGDPGGGMGGDVGDTAGSTGGSESGGTGGQATAGAGGGLVPRTANQTDTCIKGVHPICADDFERYTVGQRPPTPPFYVSTDATTKLVVASDKH